MSRWMTPWRWAYASAPATARVIRSASSTGSGPSREPRPERLAAGVRHHEEELAVALSRIVQREDLRMGEPRRDPDLAEKAARLVSPARLRDGAP